MMLLGRSASFLLVILAGLACGQVAWARDNILFILDASGSMWGKVDGIAKIDTAKRTLGTLAADLPADVNVGLMAYGFRRKNDCADVSMVLPMGGANPERIRAALKEIRPLGKTPMARALRMSGDVFSGRKGDNNNVVLISDGIETCGGDPCMEAGRLAGAGIGVRIHVVGFDVSGEASRQLHCIALQGKGRYFPVEHAKAFVNAVRQAARVAQVSPGAAETPKKPAQPASPSWTTIFEDEFEGEELSNHWTLKNPDPDSFIVEDGHALFIVGSKGALSKNTVRNLLVLDRPLPKGNWRVTMVFNVDMGADWTRAMVGAFRDKDNFIVSVFRLFLYVWQVTDRENTRLEITKVTRGKVKTQSAVATKQYMAKDFQTLMKKLPQPIFLRLRKTGRKYVSSVRLGPNGKWKSLPAMRMLRMPDKLVIGFALEKDSPGESAIRLERVVLEAEQAPSGAMDNR